MDIIDGSCVRATAVHRDARPNKSETAPWLVEASSRGSLAKVERGQEQRQEIGNEAHVIGQWLSVRLDVHCSSVCAWCILHRGVAAVGGW